MNEILAVSSTHPCGDGTLRTGSAVKAKRFWLTCCLFGLVVPATIVLVSLCVFRDLIVPRAPAFIWELSQNWDGTKLIIAREDPRGGTDAAVVWDVNAKRVLRAIQEDVRFDVHSIRHVAANPEGDWVATSADAKYQATAIWNAESGELHKRLTWAGRKTLGSRKVCFVGEGKFIASLSPACNEVSVNLTNDGTLKWRNEDAPITAIATHPQGHLVVASREKSVRIFDMENGTVMRELSLSKYLSGSQIASLVAVEQSDRYVAVSIESGNMGGGVLLWDLHVPDQDPFRLLGNVPIASMGFSTDRLLVLGDADGMISAWNIRERKMTWLQRGVTNGRYLSLMALSGNGEVLATASEVAPIQLWHREGDRFVEFDRLSVHPSVRSIWAMK